MHTQKQQLQSDISVHVPVMLSQVVEHMSLSSGDTVFDGTYGGGGYSQEILSHIGPEGSIIASDQDSVVIDRERTRNEHNGFNNITLVHSNFSQIARIAQEHNVDAFDSIVLDLGISSDQLADRERGISFKYADAPLDMRMNASEDNHLTAWGIINSWSQDELADLFFHYGGERSSRRIARAIVDARSGKPIDTVGELVSVIETELPGRGKIHPATKTFQSLRIAVNRELASLEEFLEAVPQVARSGTRLVIVTFHSLEDRIVKDTFRTWKQAKQGVVDPKKSLQPTRDEVQANKRSRSARLRGFTFA